MKMESTSESFNQINESSLNRLPEKSNLPVMQGKENDYYYAPTTNPISHNKPRVPSAVPKFQEKENDYYYAQTSRPIDNGLHHARRPLQSFNRPMPRQFDDDVFYPSSIGSALTATPDFTKPDGRSSREIKHDLEKIYHRVQENERRSQMSFYPTARPISRRASSTVGNRIPSAHPIAKPTVHRSSSVGPVGSRISSAHPIANPTALRSSSIGPNANHRNERQVNFNIPTKPSSQSSIVPKVDRVSRSSKIISQDQLEKDKKGLIDDIDLNYPHLLTLLKPVVLKTSNELPKNILNALRKRHELLVSGLKRAQTSMSLATEERRRRLISEIREKKDEQLACLSLIEQITSRFFPNGTDRPGNVGAVTDQIRYIRSIFSLNWALSH